MSDYFIVYWFDNNMLAIGNYRQKKRPTKVYEPTRSSLGRIVRIVERMATQKTIYVGGWGVVIEE